MATTRRHHARHYRLIPFKEVAANRVASVIARSIRSKRSRRLEKADLAVKLQNEITASSYGFSRGVNRPRGRSEGDNVRKTKRRHVQVQGER